MTSQPSSIVTMSPALADLLAQQKALRAQIKLLRANGSHELPKVVVKALNARIARRIKNGDDTTTAIETVLTDVRDAVERARQ